MKRFKSISAMFIAGIAVIFAFNVYYLISLYASIRESVERDVMAALADTDIDDMWERALRHNRMAVANLEEDSVDNPHRRGIRGEMNDDGNFSTTSVSANGEISQSEYPVDHDESYTNQMILEMSRQMHNQMDGVVAFNLTVTDSILTVRLSDRGLNPEFAAIEIVDSVGRILQGNIHVSKDKRAYEMFDLQVGPQSGMTYRAYISPLTRHIVSKMSGVIVTVILLMLAFASAFYYLISTVSKLRTIEEMKDDFVANMTHELKTPLSIAYSANDALLNYGASDDAAKRKNYLLIANKQLGLLREMIENILSMSMERRRTLKFKIETIHLRPFIEELVETQRMRLEKPITIELDVRENPTVEADRSHLSNVLNNLIDNAIKYSGDSVRILVKCDFSQISVADNGIGIPTKSIPFIFNKFYRVPQGNRQDSRGYGIGLYYVRNIVEKMGWTISVKSKPGKGSVFTIKFNDYGI